MLKTASATIALLALCNPALISSAWPPAAPARTKLRPQNRGAATGTDGGRAAMPRSGAYNRFVNTYAAELQSSDATLKTFFVRRGGEHGEAGYDTFKTKAANLSALEQARHAGAFCADAHVLFAAALANPGSLMSFVDAAFGAPSADLGDASAPSPGPRAGTPVKDAGAGASGRGRAPTPAAGDVAGCRRITCPPCPIGVKSAATAPRRPPDYDADDEASSRE